MVLKRSVLIHYYEFYLCTVFVYANGSWLFFEVDKLIVFGLQLISILLYIYILLRNGENLRKPNALIGLLIVMPIFSKFLNLNVNSDFTNTLSNTLLYLSLGFLSKERLNLLLDRFARVIYFLCIITLIIGPISLINYSLLSIFPVHHSGFDIDSLGYYNLYIYTDRVSNDFRTQSIFWEPGAWAFNLTFAFFWIVVEKKEYRKLPYFILGMLLASSTTGFFSLLLILVYLIIKSNDAKLRKTIAVYFFAALFLVSGALFYIQTKTDLNIGGILYDQTIGKLNGTSDATAISLDQRKESTYKAFNIAFSNPLFGLGKLGATDSLFVTSSIAEIAYQLGLVYLIIYVLTFRTVFNRLGFVLSSLFVINLLNGEAISYYILCTLILIYGARLAMTKNNDSIETVDIVSA